MTDRMTAERFKELHPNVVVVINNERDGSTRYRAMKGTWTLFQAFDFDGENDPYGDLHRQFQERFEAIKGDYTIGVDLAAVPWQKKTS